ncbi:innexin unc-7-like [Mercenaria mercenaria]|uniref:innexin unc-7-like n=1 Tax=Mercenaria mercenaria TaxID=6596 RepID=UPI00234F0D03|nr:innexin unc-7-like [Mercenaria mercenaria]
MPTVSHGLFRWLLWRGATLENFADRLNHFWTFGLLLLLACIISWNHNYNKPISCWAPVEFTKGMQQYADEICWHKQFVYLPLDAELPSYAQTRLPMKRSLHMWLPIILCFQAFLFKLPNLLMYILHQYSGISFDKLARLTSGFENMNMQERIILSKQTSRYIYNWCKQFANCLPWRLLTILWLIVKVLYCINIIVQICLVNTFLASRDPLTGYSISYGKAITRNIFSSDSSLWADSPAFPRLILCDFQIRKLRVVQRYTVQCNLNGNNFNELVFMFLWVWFVFVAVATCLSLVVWTLRTIIPIFRKRYIKKVMELADDPNFTVIRPHDLDQFCNFIGEDGTMALKLIGANSSELFVGDVVYNMWMLRSRGGNPQQALQPSAPI